MDSKHAVKLFKDISGYLCTWDDPIRDLTHSQLMAITDKCAYLFSLSIS